MTRTPIIGLRLNPPPIANYLAFFGKMNEEDFPQETFQEGLRFANALSAFKGDYTWTGDDLWTGNERELKPRRRKDLTDLEVRACIMLPTDKEQIITSIYEASRKKRPFLATRALVTNPKTPNERRIWFTKNPKGKNIYTEQGFWTDPTLILR